MYSKVKGEGPEPQGNQVLRGRVKLYVVDPKPSELAMSRLKSG